MKNKQLKLTISLPANIPEELIKYILYINKDYILYGKRKIELVSGQELERFLELTEK